MPKNCLGMRVRFCKVKKEFCPKVWDGQEEDKGKLRMEISLELSKQVTEGSWRTDQH